MMQTSQNGIDLIKQFEGYFPHTYTCPAGIITIGYGHTGSEAYWDNEVTEREAERLLIADLVTVEGSIETLVKVKLNQNQFDSLASFVFNLGASALKRSTLLRLLNNGDYTGAATEFCKWNKYKNRVTGEIKILPGLIRRRCEEAILFLKED